MMARRGHVYPQVDPGAASLVDTAVAPVPVGASVEQALAVSHARQAALVAAGDAHVLREDLVRAATLGLGDLGATELARPLPIVDARAPETGVRRHLLAGAPFVIVRDRGRPAGAIAERSAPADDEPALFMAARITAAMSPAVVDLLRETGELARACGARAFLVGGLVRDLFRAIDFPPVDADVVVEGDGLAIARRLAARRGARLVEHGRFLTASIEGGPEADGLARLDIVTARTERYEARGALPRVIPADIAADLRRRDFTVNAMAVELGSGRFGLLDPLGGRADLAARRLRVLHPLSFVEDPTRIFRAARYAVRLGLSQDRWTSAAQGLALRLVPYPRLSGQRITAELERIVAEPGAGAVLELLGTTDAFGLLDPRYRSTRATTTRLRGLAETLAWATAHRVEVRALELAVVAVLADQAPGVTAASLRRLAFTGETLARLEGSVSAAADAAAALRGAGTASARARTLRRLHPLELAWLHLAGGARVRAVVGWFVEHARGAVPALRGEDVIALGVPRGPAVARALERLTDACLDGAVSDAEAERAFVRALVTARAAGPAGDGEAANHSTRGEA